MSRAGGIRAGRAYVEIGVNDRFTKGLRQAERRLRAFADGARAVGATLFGVGAGTSAALAIPTRIFAGFDDQMRSVRAITGATLADFQRLTETAKELGSTTSFTAAQVAGAMTELARAGFVADEINKATGGILNLARATDTDLALAAEIAGNSLRGFGLEADEIGRVADVLTAAVNGSAQRLEDFAEAQKVLAPIAAEAGATIEETAAAIGLLANNGIRGSLAGNAIARAYKNLSDELKRAELERFGVEAVDAAGNLRPLSDILAELGQATRGLGSAERLAIFETLFGRGQAAALKLAGEGAAFDSLLASIQGSAGEAERIAVQMDAGIGGAFRKIGSAVEGVAIEIGDALAPVLTVVADRVVKIAGVVGEWVRENQGLIVTIAGVAAGVAAAGAALIAIGIGAAVAAAAMGGLAAIFAIAVKVVVALVSPLGLVIGAVVAAGAAILHFSGIAGDAFAWIKEQAVALLGEIDRVLGGVRDALLAGDIELAAKIMWLGIKTAWQAGIDAINGAWLATKTFFIKIANQMIFGAAAAIQIGVNAIEVAWVETVAFMGKVWTKFSTGIQTAWREAVGFVAKGFAEIQGLFDDSLDVAAVKEDIDRETASRVGQLQREAERSLDARERERARKRQQLAEENEAILADIGRELESAEDAAEAQAESRRERTRSALRRTQEELDAALEEAKQARNALDQEREATRSERQRAIGGAFGGIDSAIQNARFVAQGTFNAADARFLRGGVQTAERQAKAAEETAKNTRTIAENTASSRPVVG